MRKANYYVLQGMARPLEMIPDDRSEQVARTSFDDEPGIRAVIRSYIVPYFHQLTEESQRRCKESLSYFLTTREAPFEKLLEELQDSPLGSDANAVKFFEWLWMELFPGEDYQTDVNGWTVDNRREDIGLFWRT